MFVAAKLLWRQIFVATKIFCRDKRILLRQMFCRDKHTFIIVGSCHKYNFACFCRDKHVFVGTEHVFCRDKSMLVTIKLLLRQKSLMVTITKTKQKCVRACVRACVRVCVCVCVCVCFSFHLNQRSRSSIYKRHGKLLRKYYLVFTTHM